MALTDKLTAIADAIREKTGSTDGLTLDGMAEAIAAIEAGGGDIRIETGSVTLAEDVTAYRFLNENPDILIVYSANTENPIYSARKGVVAFVHNRNKSWYFGYNKGSQKYYEPYSTTDTSPSAGQNTHSFASGNFNSYLLASASPYVWYAIWGVE